MTIISSKLRGCVRIPSSKSISHRAVICAGLSRGVSIIGNINFSQDIDATIGAMKSFGVHAEKGDFSLKISGAGKLDVTDERVDCFESGSTLRFLIPIAALTGKRVVFSGRGELVNRPLGPYFKIFDEKHVRYETRDGRLPLTVEGKLAPGEYRIRGDVSSQFISGLLFALPLLEGDSKITITSELESKAYVDLTVDMLKRFSVNVDNLGYREFLIKGNQRYSPVDCSVEGDFSQAAFWLVAGCLGADVECLGLDLSSLQGDKAILDIIRQMGGSIDIKGDSVRALPSKTKGIIFDASECPDLVPAVTVLASLSEGTTEIVNAARLRIKECDRLKAICTELNKIGADIEEKEDGLIIRGKDQLRGGTTRSWGDHRIAMSLAAASIRCSEPLVIEDSSSVRKSYPEFWNHFKMLGGVLDERNMGQ
ncbi:MAG: 3-phosphoshikimate 1-carboxyvinyltransferase [Firmicutes bacterium]|nr:3-phosphoshikimate 1-carboxyvinyltransferase [Bacillota bacterium]